MNQHKQFPVAVFVFLAVLISAAGSFSLIEQSQNGLQGDVVYESRRMKRFRRMAKVETGVTLQTRTTKRFSPTGTGIDRSKWIRRNRQVVFINTGSLSTGTRSTTRIRDQEIVRTNWEKRAYARLKKKHGSGSRTGTGWVRETKRFDPDAIVRDIWEDRTYARLLKRLGVASGSTVYEIRETLLKEDMETEAQPEWKDRIVARVLKRLDAETPSYTVRETERGRDKAITRETWVHRLRKRIADRIAKHSAAPEETGTGSTTETED